MGLKATDGKKKTPKQKATYAYIYIYTHIMEQTTKKSDNR